MRTAAFVTGSIVLLLLAGCGSETGGAGGTGGTGSDPTGDRGSGPMPTSVPAAPGGVRTRGVVTILDAGRPELCLGPVAESWPPQCSGPPVIGWDWKRQRLVLGQPGGPQGDASGPRDHERAGAVRWGQYFLTGRWDGTAFTVVTSVPAALYDAAPEQPAGTPPAGSEPALGQNDLEPVSRELAGDLPGALTSYVQEGRVVVDVVYDDGSLQEWADGEYGRGSVVVNSMLVDVADPTGG